MRRNRWRFANTSIRAFVHGTVAFVAAFGLMQSSCAGKSKEAISISSAHLRDVLANGLKAHGTAVANSHTEYLGLSYSTYQRWKINISLVNQTDCNLILGSDLFMVESNPEASIVDGVAYFRGQPRAGETSFARTSAWTFSYPLSNYERHFTDGGKFVRRGTTISMSISDTHSKSTARAANKEPIDFGRLAPGGRMPVSLELDEGAWLKLEALASLRLVLPEISVATTHGRERFRLVLFFERQNADSGTWNVARQELTHLGHEELAKIVGTVESNSISRIFAAHWLVDLEGAKAGPVLAAACRPLKQGEFLATGLELMTAIKASDLSDYALTLFTNKEAPNGIRSRAADYLGALRYTPALPAILSALNDADEVIGKSAIRNAGAIGGKQAADSLIKLLKKKTDSDRDGITCDALLNTGDSSAVPTLQELAEDGREAAIDALVDAGRPESFEYFCRMTKNTKHKQWRDKLVHGLKTSGGANALPIFIDLLADEAPPSLDAPLAKSALVDEMISLDPLPVRDTLFGLARNNNLRALQVLSGWQNSASRDMLLELAQRTHGAALRIVIDGIANNWAKEGRAVLNSMLRNDQVEIVRAAIEGLGNSGETSEVDTLIPFIDNKEVSLANAAADAIEKLGPGTHQDAILQKILKTDDDSMRISLTNSLIDHQWKDRKAIKPLIEHLSSTDNDKRFQIIRLLRQISGNAMGPESYSQCLDKPDEWVRQWREWAAKQ